MMHINNRLKEEGGFKVYNLVTVRSKPFNLKCRGAREEASSYLIPVLYHAFYIQYIRKSVR